MQFLHVHQNQAAVRWCVCWHQFRCLNPHGNLRKAQSRPEQTISGPTHIRDIETVRHEYGYSHVAIHTLQVPFLAHAERLRCCRLHKIINFLSQTNNYSVI